MNPKLAKDIEQKDVSSGEKMPAAGSGLTLSLEMMHVTEVYNQIAGEFSSTRHTPWPRVSEFLLSLAPGSVGYDVGCGNGKYCQVNPKVCMIGVDTSVELLTISQSKGMPAILSDARTLPLRSESADYVISIAVLHHLSTDQGRLQAVQEIGRVLKPCGSALLTVWAFEQNKNGSDSKYIKSSTTSTSKAEKSGNCSVTHSSDSKRAPDATSKTAAAAAATNTAKGLPIHKSRTPFQSQDVLVPWTCKQKNETLLRYYHVFVEHELADLCNRIPGISVFDHFYDQGNWCVVIRKAKADHESIEMAR